MSNMMPGQAPWRPTSFRSPLVQLGLALGLFVLAWWANGHDDVVRTFGTWAYDVLAAMSALTGVLFLLFAGAGFVRVARNRRAATRSEALTGR